MISLNKVGEKIANFLGDKETYGTSTVSDFKDFKSLTDHSPFAHLLPYQTYDEAREIFLNDDSVGFGLELSPLTGCGEDSIERLASLFNEKLPDNGNLHIQLFSTNKIGKKLDAFYKSRCGFSEVNKKLASNRVNYYKKGANESLNNYMPLYIKDYKLFIYYSEPVSSAIDMQIEDLEHLREVWRTSLSSITQTQNLNVNSFLAVVKEILNPSDDVYWPKVNHNKYDSISGQVLSIDTTYDVNDTNLGVKSDNKDYVVQCYNTERMAERTSLWQTSENIGKMMEPALQMSCPLIINLHIKASSKAKSKEKAQNTYVMNDKNANSPLTKFVPSLRKSHQEWGLLRENLNGSERLVQASYQITLFSKRKNHKKDASRLEDLMSSNDWSMKADRYLQLPSFLQNLPFLMTSGLEKDLLYFKRFKTMTMFNAVNIMPLVTEWKGLACSEGLMFVGRRGQLINWSNFGGNPGNYNIAVAASSGSGKSFMMQEIVSNIVCQKGVVRIIDLGRSYEKLCKVVGGQFIEITDEVCLNPFTNVKNFADSQSQIKSIVSTMAHPSGGTSDLEISFITKAIKNAWAKYKNKATITHIIEDLKTYDDTNAYNLVLLLESYGKGGQYESFFEGDSTIDTNNPFMVLELNELRDADDLKAVVVNTIIQQINEEFYGMPQDIKKLCVIDEAWDLLGKSKQAADFIEEGFRRIRKQNGAFVTIVQSMNDYHGNAMGDVILANSASKLLLAQDSGTLDELKKNEKLVLTPFEERALRSFDTENRDYKECLIKTAAGSCPVKVIVEPFTRILYSTKGEEVQAVNNLVSQGYSMADAVDLIAKKVFADI